MSKQGPAIKVRFIIGLSVLSLLSAALVCQYTGDRWEEEVRNGLYTLTRDSVPNYAVDQEDPNGIPRSYYPTQNGITPGWQYNATIVCNFALKHYQKMQEDGDTAARRKFLHCAEWLATNLTHRENYALYVFEWQQPWYDSVKTPFTCGMTSGLAMEVFIHAHALTSNPAYLHHAASLMRGYYLPIEKGGFTYAEPQGWWYEEIADTGRHTPRILDGHIFALLGAHAYWKASGNDSARYLYQQGVDALKHSLPFFDAGPEHIYYDVYHKVADKKYHRTLTRQMQQLWEISGDSTFLHYYQKWNAPLKRPYLFRVIKEGNRSGIMLLLLLSLAFSSLFLGIYRLAKKA